MPPTAVATSTKVAVPKQPPPGIALRSLEDVVGIATLMFKGGVMPPGIDRPEKLAVLILAGLDVGLTPTQAAGSIMLTAGKPAIYGDGALALVRVSGLLESIDEQVTGTGDDRRGTCKVKRKGEQERTFTFSMGEAKRAGLIERAKDKGPWATYPDRMLIMRARGYALRDVFPDVLRGLVTAEEAMDASASPPAQPQKYEVVSVAVMADEPGPKPVAASQPAELPPAAQDRPAPAAAPVAETKTALTGPATDEQLTELRRLLGIAFAANGGMPDADRRKFILDLLTPFGVATAKELTAAQLDEVNTRLGKQWCFTYPQSQAA